MSSTTFPTPKMYRLWHGHYDDEEDEGAEDTLVGED
jgi:hypothetical protein